MRYFGMEGEIDMQNVGYYNGEIGALEEMKIPMLDGSMVPKEAAAQIAITTTIDFFIFVLLIIQIHNVMLEIKEINPTAALMIPL